MTGGSAAVGVQPRVSRRGGAFGAATLTFLLLAAASRLAVSQPASEVQSTAARPPVTGTRGPLRLAFTPDGEQVLVSESDSGRIAVVDSRTGVVRARWASGGEQPDGIAVLPDGSGVVVANVFSGGLALLELPSGRPRFRLSLRGMPTGVAVTSDGRTAFVSVSQLDAVAVVDLTTGQERARVGVGRRPQALALTPDGHSLLCANMAGGSLSIIDTASLKETARVSVGGVNVRGVAVHPSGQSAFVTLQPPLAFQTTAYPIDIWHNFIREVKLQGAASALGEEHWMDFGEIGSADQDGIAISPDGRYAYVAIAGRHTAAQIRILERSRVTIWPDVFREVPVGANPRGLALSPDGTRLWVANRLGNSLSVVETRSMRLERTVDLGRPEASDPALYGKFLFASAHLSRDGRFTCNSCHPDGAADGLTWRFGHVADRLARRNSRDLRGGVPETPPYRWSGHDASLGEFIQEEVTGLLRGPRLSPADLHALRLAVTAFRLPPNPHRLPNGQLTPAALRGRGIFAGKAGCGGCHDGPRLGGSGKGAWVGTTPGGLELDVPHLSGVYDSPPYLHDGRAATLADVFSEHNRARRHGNADRLDEAELADLMAFLREQ